MRRVKEKEREGEKYRKDGVKESKRRTVVSVRERKRVSGVETGDETIRDMGGLPCTCVRRVGR